METLFLFIAKSSVLITMFYIAYYFLLRKETFFTANRWFLLAGLVTSTILPWIIFTTIVWVEPTPTNFDWSQLQHTPSEKENFTINWYIVMGVTYAIGIALFFIQFVTDFYKLNRVIKGKAVQQQADHKYIDLKENIAPFSYFNTIVYNSSLYTEAEMESILEHEKVHSDQNHTVDVLIMRFFCILFWFNPFIWWYKKAILQNLEFIADHEAAKNISDKKAYQLTLLKITTHENCVTITNHFYQSLIKKRIVMLNKNRSKKSNSWKYVVVLPALVAFVLLFQIEVIAKEKQHSAVTQKSISTADDVDVYRITKNTTEAELQEKVVAISKVYGIEVRFTNTKRNTNNELTALTVDLKKGKEVSQNRKIKSSDAITTFSIVITKDSEGKITVAFAEETPTSDTPILISTITKEQIPLHENQIFIDGAKSDKAKMDQLNPVDIASINVTKNDGKKEIRIITKNHRQLGNENEIYINGKKVSQNEFDLLDQGTIESMDVNKNAKTIKIFTKKETYTMDTNGTVLPVPPVSPVAPVMNFKAPVAPSFPKAPKAPKGDPVNGNKKAWKEFDKKRVEYEAKMTKLEPQMEAFDKQMAEFDKKWNLLTKKCKFLTKK